MELLHVKKEEKKVDSTFTEELLKSALVVYNMGLLKHFGTENCV